MIFYTSDLKISKSLSLNPICQGFFNNTKSEPKFCYKF
jgi:hypothetical protein